MQTCESIGPRQPWRALGAALLVAMPLYVFGTFGHDLWRPAEPREAGIAREMVESGNWVATHLNGRLFLEKPPFYTWAIALPMKAFGFKVWVVRLPVIVFTAGTLTLTFLLARRRLGLFGAQAALVSLATMWLFWEVNHGAMIDNGLVFFTTLGMLAFERLAHDQKSGRSWAAAFYGALGIAFLCKGAIGPLLILSGVGAHMLAGRRWKPAARVYPWIGLGVLVVLVGGWLWALWQRGGAEYFHVFFVKNHWNRFVGREGPRGAWFLYVPYLLAGTLPWTLLLPAGLWAVWQRRRLPEERPYWDLILGWVAAMFLVLSVAASKHNQYLLPLLPALAIVAGAWVEYTLTSSRLPRWARVLTGLFCFLAAIGAAAFPWVSVLAERHWRLVPIALSVALLVPGAMAVRACRLRAWPRMWTALAALAIGMGLSLGLCVEKTLNASKSSDRLCVLLQEQASAGVAVWEYGLNENTLGLLIFHGFHPRPISTFDQAKRVGAAGQPAILVMESRHASATVVREFDALPEWAVVRAERIGGLHYWFLGNIAARRL